MTKVMFLFFTGLVTTMFGAGGVENSVTNGDLLAAMLVSVTGLAIMWCATLMLRQEQ